jgi:hypothetical protein
VEAKNLLRTFDSCKMCSKGLEDEGAVKEPLPFLKIMLLLDVEWHI